MTRRKAPPKWDFLSNHTLVLLCLGEGDSSIPLRNVAEQVGITERAAQKIVLDLEQAGFLTRQRHGRNNSYKIITKCSLSHPLTPSCSIGELLACVRGMRDVKKPDIDKSIPKEQTTVRQGKLTITIR